MGAEKRFVFFTTTDGRAQSIQKLVRMVNSVERAQSTLAMPVRIRLLLQNSRDGALISLQQQLPNFVAVQTIDHQISLSAARNHLLKHAAQTDAIKGDDIVGFPDDDCWFPDGSLSHIEAMFLGRPELDFWFCRYGADARLAERMDELRPSLGTVIANASSNTMFFRGALVCKSGSFDEKLGVGAKINGGEDTDYAIRIYYAARESLFLNEKLVGHRDFDKALRARYFPGSFAAILRHAPLSRSGWIAAGRKFAIGLVFVFSGKLKVKDFLEAFAVALDRRPNEAAL